MSTNGLVRLERATFVTGNADKLAEARRLSGCPLRSLDIDLPEIQSLDLSEVLAAKAAEARRHSGGPVLVEETAFELTAMNGFPGPLIKWMLEAIGPEGLAQTAIAAGDPRGTARCRILLLDETGAIEVEGITVGELVLPGRGSRGFGWDPVFRPLESQRTYGELGNEEKDSFSHRGKAWRALRSRLDDPAA